VKQRSLFMPGVLALASGFCCGCTTFTRAEMDLVTQTQRGVTLVAQHDDQRDRAVAELARLRRAQLDEAFDADVRDRATQETLDPEWVIEARRAYAVALDAHAKARAANERSAAARRLNLAAINAALDRLQWLQSVRLRLDPFREELSTHDQPQQEQP
jgi:hypothetical protein